MIRLRLAGVNPPPAEPEKTRQRVRRGPRGLSFKSLVKLALECDSAEQLGQRLRRRYDRQQQRQGIAPVGNGRAEAEVAERLDRVLGPP